MKTELNKNRLLVCTNEHIIFFHFCFFSYSYVYFVKKKKINSYVGLLFFLQLLASHRRRKAYTAHAAWQLGDKHDQNKNYNDLSCKCVRWSGVTLDKATLRADVAKHGTTDNVFHYTQH